MVAQTEKLKARKYRLIIFIILILIAAQFLILTCLISCYSGGIKSIKFPDYNSYVNDYTGTISGETLAMTEELVQDLREKTSCELAVAVIDKLDGVTIEEYAEGLFDTWGIGKKDKDNGVLLLVAIKDRELRIEVGYGLEAVITDLKAKDVIEAVIAPRFKNQDYNTAIYNGAVAIANIIYQDKNKALLAYSDSNVPSPENKSGGFSYIALIVILANFLPWFIIGTVIGSFVLRQYIKNHKCPKCKKIALIIITKVLSRPTYEHSGRAHIEKYCKKCDFRQVSTITLPILVKSSHLGSYSSSHSFSSESSSFSSSSHSSSFGGGSSGGGGASGRW